MCSAMSWAYDPWVENEYSACKVYGYKCDKKCVIGETCDDVCKILPAEQCKPACAVRCPSLPVSSGLSCPLACCLILVRCCCASMGWKWQDITSAGYYMATITRVQQRQGCQNTRMFDFLAC